MLCNIQEHLRSNLGKSELTRQGRQGKIKSSSTSSFQLAMLGLQ